MFLETFGEIESSGQRWMIVTLEKHREEGIDWSTVPRSRASPTKGYVSTAPDSSSV